VTVNSVSSPQSVDPDQVVPPPAPGSADWHLVRLTDAPIQILGIYLFMSLVLPAVLLMIDQELWPPFYRYEDFSILEGIAVIGTVALACALRHLQWTHTSEVVVRHRAIFFYSMQKLRIVVLLVAIVVSIVNFANSGFRYDDIGLSEKGSFSLYVYALVPAFVKLLLIYHAFIYRGTSAMDRFERALVTAALAASINGNGAAFIAVFSFLVLQTNASAYLFKRTFGTASALRIVVLFSVGTVLIAMVSAVLAGAYVYGESVKRGEEVTSVFDTFLAFGEGYTEVLFNRLVPAYASLANTLPLTFDFNQDSFGNLAGVWNTFLFRLQTLDIFQFGVGRESTAPISRLNVEFINRVAVTEREGTAPGLIPGFLYCFPPFLNVLMLGAYVFMVLGIFQRLCLCVIEEMSFFGKFILTYFALSLFETPVDLMLIIDDGFIFFVGLWWMSRLVDQVRVADPTSPTASQASVGW